MEGWTARKLRGWVDGKALTNFSGDFLCDVDQKLVSFRKSAVLINDQRFVIPDDEWIVGIAVGVDLRRGSVRFGFFQDDGISTQRIIKVMTPEGILDVLVTAPGRDEVTLVEVK